MTAPGAWPRSTRRERPARASSTRPGHPPGPAPGQGRARRPAREHRGGRRRDHHRPSRAIVTADRAPALDLDQPLPRIAAGDRAAFAEWMRGAEPRIRDSLRSFAATLVRGYCGCGGRCAGDAPSRLAGGPALRPGRPRERAAPAGHSHRAELRDLPATPPPARAGPDRGAGGGRASRRGLGSGAGPR